MTETPSTVLRLDSLQQNSDSDTVLLTAVRETGLVTVTSGHVFITQENQIMYTGHLQSVRGHGPKETHIFLLDIIN